MNIEVKNPAELAEKITEKLPQNERTIFVFFVITVLMIIVISYFFISSQKEQRDAFLMQIEKAAEVTDRREQRTQQSIEKLSDSIDRNTQLMSELKHQLAK